MTEAFGCFWYHQCMVVDADCSTFKSMAIIDTSGEELRTSEELCSALSAVFRPPNFLENLLQYQKKHKTTEGMNSQTQKTGAYGYCVSQGHHVHLSC